MTGVNFSRSAANRIIAATKRVESMRTPTVTQGGRTYKNLQNEFLVKLTDDISNSTKWEAEEVYLDTGGEATTVPNGAIFDNNNPVFTTVAANVDDVVIVRPKYRPDGSLYWLGDVSGGGGGGGAGNIRVVENKTEILNSASGTWKIPGASDLGTFADQSALETAHPAPTDNEYAFVTSTGTYWIASNNLWSDTGEGDIQDAGIEGTWTVRHSAALQSTGGVDCEAGAYLELVWFAYENIWLANRNFILYRGPAPA